MYDKHTWELVSLPQRHTPTMTKWDTTPTPMLKRTKLIIDLEQPYVDVKLHQKMLGKLIYLTQSRHDISHLISFVSRYMNQPQVPHMLAVKHIFKHLKATNNLGLCYKRVRYILTGHTDAHGDGDTHDRKSTIDIFRLGGTPITWNSKTQTTLAFVQLKLNTWHLQKEQRMPYGCTNYSKKFKCFKAHLQQ